MINIKKAFLILFCSTFYTLSNAEIIYPDINNKSFDMADIPKSELCVKANGGDNKAKYLLALHKIHDKNQKEHGIKMLKALAGAGVLDADQALYKLSRWIEVASLNKEEGLKYLKAGAEGGYAVSQFDLAMAYDEGRFGYQDLQQYHYWLEKSAVQGYKRALAYIATDYYSGRGVTKDDGKGFEWLIKAYKMLGRNYDKWDMLGEAYETGRGTSVDLVKAYMCYDLLGTAGIEEKARIAPRMTAAQRAEGLRLSQEWQQKNHVYTMQSLGLKRQKDGSYQ